MENPQITTQEVESKSLLSIRKPIQWKDSEQEMGGMYGELMQYLQVNNIQFAAPPICLMHQWDNVGGDIECGVLIEGKNEGNERIKSSTSYAGKTLCIKHVGTYASTSESWGKLFNYTKENSITTGGVPWEEYITDPRIEPDTSKLITNLYFPIK